MCGNHNRSILHKICFFTAKSTQISDEDVSIDISKICQIIFNCVSKWANFTKYLHTFFKILFGNSIDGNSLNFSTLATIHHNSMQIGIFFKKLFPKKLYIQLQRQVTYTERKIKPT